MFTGYQTLQDFGCEQLGWEHQSVDPCERWTLGEYTLLCPRYISSLALSPAKASRLSIAARASLIVSSLNPKQLATGIPLCSLCYDRGYRVTCRAPSDRIPQPSTKRNRHRGIHCMNT